MPLPEIEGLERIEEAPDTYYVRPEWKSHLLQPLKTRFALLPRTNRTPLPGRSDHFSFQPPGAPARVVVRRATRGGAVSFMGERHVGLGRLRRELQTSRAFAAAGIEIPELLAVHVRADALLFCRFTFVTREIPGASDLSKAWTEGDRRQRRDLMDRLAAALRHLHDAGIYHGDLTPQNVLVTGDRRLYFVDFDRSRILPQRQVRRDRSNLARLNRYLEKWFPGDLRPTRSDKLRFLHQYAAATADVKETARHCARGMLRHRIAWLLSHRAPA